MKKLFLFFISALTLSFTPKVIVRVSTVIWSVPAYSQLGNYYFSSDRAAKTAGVYNDISGTRVPKLFFTPGTMKLSCSKIILDSFLIAKNSTMLTGAMIPWINSGTGELNACRMDTISKYLVISPSSITWTGTSSQYILGNGSMATKITNNNQLTNGSGYITSYTETDPLFDSKFIAKTTTSLTEGTNLYYTPARFNTAFGGKSTSDLLEGANQYFTSTRARASSSAGAGIDYSSGVITNTMPNIVQSLSGSNTNTFTLSNGGGVVVVPSNTLVALNGLTVTSGVNTFTITQKRKECYSGLTNAAGNYTAAFSSSFAVTPNIQACISSQSLTNQYSRVSAVSATGFTISAYSFNTNTLLGIVSLVSTTSLLIGIPIDVVISEK